MIQNYAQQLKRIVKKKKKGEKNRVKNLLTSSYAVLAVKFFLHDRSLDNTKS